MSSLLHVVVKSHLFSQFVHLNRERGKVAAVTIAVGTGERGQVATVNHAWHSRDRQGGGSPSCERAIHRSQAAAVTHNPDPQ